VIATPAISDGRVFIRTEGTLYAFGTSAPLVPRTVRDPPQR
jgi:hypothetical protein